MLKSITRGSVGGAEAREDPKGVDVACRSEGRVKWLTASHTEAGWCPVTPQKSDEESEEKAMSQTAEWRELIHGDVEGFGRWLTSGRI